MLLYSAQMIQQTPNQLGLVLSSSAGLAPEVDLPEERKQLKHQKGHQDLRQCWEKQTPFQHAA